MKNIVSPNSGLYVTTSIASKEAVIKDAANELGLEERIVM